MLEVFSKVFGKESSSSKEIAKERLRLVLVHDRATVSPRFLEMIKEEVMEVISNYMEIDEAGMEVTLDTMEESVALLASIPIKRMKRLTSTG
jgi:cell division topological specificity factor